MPNKDFIFRSLLLKIGKYSLISCDSKRSASNSVLNIFNFNFENLLISLFRPYLICCCMRVLIFYSFLCIKYYHLHQ